MHPTPHRRISSHAVSEKLSSLRPQVYADPRPKEHFDRFHERARRRGPSFVYDLVRIFSSFYAWTLLRARSIDAQKVPETGAAILAPNHFSYMDHFLVGIFIRRKVRFMAKSQLFSPLAQWVYLQGGVFPVRRGARDEEAFITAEAILARGGVVVMYPEGGRSRSGRLSEAAKPGIGRLALESGAPVVPIAILGSSRIRNWKRGRFPRIRVQFGEPVTFEAEPQASRERHQEVADAVFGEIRSLYGRLSERFGG
jgi:1-acyl-sn-glycerol-3-phosphate acyltransferase